MGKLLTPTQVLQEWSKLIEGSRPTPEALERYYEGLLKLIYKELLEHGEIQLPRLGSIYATLRKGKEIHNSMIGHVYVEPRLLPHMKFSERLKDSLRYGVPYETKFERQRRKKKVEIVEEKSDEAKRVEIVAWLEKKEETGKDIVQLYDEHVRRERAKRKKRKNG